MQTQSSKIKNIKIYWDYYQTTGVKTFASLTGTWNNIDINAKIPIDYEIFIDDYTAPATGVFMHVEPKSISPHLYNTDVKKYKHVLSYDVVHYNSYSNFIKIPPPFDAWIPKNERGVFNKTKNISFIASTKQFCAEHIFRQEMVKRFSSICDVFGNGRSREISSKSMGLSDYRFSFCMENHITDLYYTEKVLDCFLTGTIPIYYGTRTIDQIFDINGIVFLDDILNNTIKIEDLNETFYAARHVSVTNNFNIANSMNNNVSNSIDHFVSKVI